MVVEGRSYVPYAFGEVLESISASQPPAIVLPTGSVRICGFERSGRVIRHTVNLKFLTSPTLYSCITIQV